MRKWRRRTPYLPPALLVRKKTLWFFARPGITGFVLVEKREPSERTGLVVAERVFWHVLRCDVGTDTAVHEEILGSSNNNNGPISVTPESDEISWVPVLPHVLTAAMANFMFGYHIGSAILTYCTVICKFCMAQCACSNLDCNNCMGYAINLEGGLF